MKRFLHNLFLGLFCLLLFWLCLDCIKLFFTPLVLSYKNTKNFTNGSIRIDEGIEGDENFGDIPARLDIIANQVRANKNGVCDIKTGKQEIGCISLEHLNMLDHFAYRYLEKSKGGRYHGDCWLVIDGEKVIGKDIEHK